MYKLLLLKYTLCVLWFVHPLKLTFSKVTFNNSNEIKIETRFFADDLSEHLMTSNRLKHIDFSSSKSNGHIALQNYINKRYYLIVNGEKSHLKIDSIKATSDHITLKVYLSNSAKKKDQITIYNKALTEVFMNQEHKVIYNKEHFTLNKYTPTLKLN